LVDRLNNRLNEEPIGRIAANDEAATMLGVIVPAGAVISAKANSLRNLLRGDSMLSP
jgi:hypothetical protein